MWRGGLIAILDVSLLFSATVFLFVNLIEEIMKTSTIFHRWLAVAVISLGIAASAQAQTKSAPAILTVSSQQSAAKDFSLADLDALSLIHI